MESSKNRDNKESKNYSLPEKEKLYNELREAIAKVTGANQQKKNESPESELSAEKAPNSEL